MNRPIINLHFMGRFGNCIFEYAFAAAYAEKHGCELKTDPWIGFRIFELAHNPIQEDLPRRSDHSLQDGEVNVSLRGYFQNARSAIYDQKQIRRWFRFRPEVEEHLSRYILPSTSIVAHLRRTDYGPLGYPLISRKSYIDACKLYGLDDSKITWVSDELPMLDNFCYGDTGFLLDFYRMAKARTLLRANSSFSFWAGALVEAYGGRVFSPMIDGIRGGIEHDVDFVPGNGSRIADFDFVDPIEILP